MKKEDFLRELDSRLHILNEAERKDILDEYAQHIDFKIANGLSEEDAAGGFWNIKTGRLVAGDVLRIKLKNM